MFASETLHDTGELAPRIMRYSHQDVFDHAATPILGNEVAPQEKELFVR
jgi:hypothetical protein